MRSLSDGLKRARRAFGYTQETLADALGVSSETIRNWEQPARKIMPSMETFLKLCDFFDCDPDYLLNVTDCKKHDVQDVVDYTHLSERAVNALHSNVNASSAELISNLIDDSYYSDGNVREMEGLLRHIHNYINLPRMNVMMGNYEGNILLVDENRETAGGVYSGYDLPYIDTNTIDRYFEPMYLLKIQQILIKMRERNIEENFNG